jgi:hypothetical protein
MFEPIWNRDHIDHVQIDVPETLAVDDLRNSPAGPSPHPDPDGTTAAANLAPGCRTHHRVKAMPGWQVTSPGPGTYRWRTPTGHTYTRHPEPPLPPPPPILPASAPKEWGPPPY